MSLRLPSTRRTLAALLAVALLLSLQVPGWASTEQKLEEAKQRAAELDQRIDAAEAELASLAAELDELEVELEAAAADLAIAEDLHRSASLAAEEATHRSNATDAELAEAQEEQEANDDTLQGIARDTYKHGLTALSPELAVFEFAAHEDAEGLADRLHFLQRSMGQRTAALDEAVSLVVRVNSLADLARQEAEEMAHLLEIAEQARADSAGAHARLDQLLADTSVKLKRQDELVADLEADREAAGARIGELEDRLEQERIERERRERERKEREERERKEREERERRERQERERQEQERQRKAAQPAASSGSGGGSGGSSRVTAGAPSGGLVTVGGITVAASLGPQLEALLNAARADGIVLGGSGYRSPEAQARLRMVNGCPDVYDSPASSCRVPTARPGSSEHEKGLAIDFTYQGQTICFPRPGSQCSGNAAFDWLKANAGSYGLRNLSSEAWHWSTTGR